jgi:RNA polymerase sigma-70 factor (ECF subfamily)
VGSSTSARKQRADSAAGREIDDVTLARARRGEEAAARAFFDHYHRVVFAYLWRMLSPRVSRALVEDLTQETFLRAFAALPRFSPNGAARPSSWLLTIATRLALNEIRRQRRNPGDLSGTEAMPVSAGCTTDEAVARRALGRLLAREIAEMQPEFRSVFLLREYHGLSYEEIADALELPLGTVQSRLARARASLRAALKDVL